MEVSLNSFIFVELDLIYLIRNYKNEKAKVTFNNEKLQVSTEILRALAHPLRLKILEYIDQYGSINVNKIYNNLEIEQSITSQHLKVLRLAGLVNQVKEGKFIHYSIEYPLVDKAVKAINNYLGK